MKKHAWDYLDTKIKKVPRNGKAYKIERSGELSDSPVIVKKFKNKKNMTMKELAMENKSINEDRKGFATFQKTGKTPARLKQERMRAIAPADVTTTITDDEINDLRFEDGHTAEQMKRRRDELRKQIEDEDDDNIDNY